MTTPVIFRKWPKSEGGDIIAIFPTEPGTNDPYTSSSYEHIGQHGSADPVGLVQRTKPATSAEYADLKVVQRISPDYLQVRKAKLAGYTIPAKRKSAPKKRKAAHKSGISTGIQ